MASQQRHVVLLFDIYSVISGACESGQKSISKSAIVRRFMCATYRLLIANSVLPVRRCCARWGFYLLDSGRTKPCVSRRRFHECTVESLRALETALASAVERALSASPRRNAAGWRCALASGATEGALNHAFQDIVSYFQWEQSSLCSPVKRRSRSHSAFSTSMSSFSYENIIYVFSALELPYISATDSCLPALNKSSVSCSSSGHSTIVEWLARDSVRHLLCDTHRVAVTVVESSCLYRPNTSGPGCCIFLPPGSWCSVLHLNDLVTTDISRIPADICQSNNLVDGNHLKEQCHLEILAKTHLTNVDVSKHTRRKTVFNINLHPDFAYLVKEPGLCPVYIFVVDNTGCTDNSSNDDRATCLSAGLFDCSPTVCLPGVSSSSLSVRNHAEWTLSASTANCTVQDVASSAVAAGIDAARVLDEGVSGEDGSHGDISGVCPLPSLMNYMLQPWFVNSCGDALCASIGKRRSDLSGALLRAVLQSDANGSISCHDGARRTRHPASSATSAKRQLTQIDKDNCPLLNGLTVGIDTGSSRSASASGGGVRRSLRRGEQIMARAAMVRATRRSTNNNSRGGVSGDAKGGAVASAGPMATADTNFGGVSGLSLDCNNMDSDQLVQSLLTLKSQCIENDGSVISCVHTILNILLLHTKSQNNAPPQGSIKESLMTILNRNFLPNKAEIARKYCADGEVRVKEYMFQVLVLIEANWVLGGSAADADLDKIVSLLRMISLRAGHAVFSEFMNTVLLANYQLSQPDLLVSIYWEMGQSPPSVFGSAAGDSCSSLRPPSSTLSSVNEPRVGGASEASSTAEIGGRQDSVSSGLRVRSSQSLSRHSSRLEMAKKRQILMPAASSTATAVCGATTSAANFGKRQSRNSTSGLARSGSSDNFSNLSDAANADSVMSAVDTDCISSANANCVGEKVSAEQKRCATEVTNAASRRNSGVCFVPETPSVQRQLLLSPPSLQDRACSLPLTRSNTSIVQESPCRTVSKSLLTPRRVSRRLALTRRSSFYGSSSSLGGGESDASQTSRVCQNLNTVGRLNHSLPLTHSSASRDIRVSLTAASANDVGSTGDFTKQALFPSLVLSPVKNPPTADGVSQSPARHVQFLLTPQKRTGTAADTRTADASTCVTPRSILKTAGCSAEKKRLLFSPDMFGDSPQRQHRQSPRLIKRKRLFSGPSSSVADGQAHASSSGDGDRIVCAASGDDVCFSVSRPVGMQPAGQGDSVTAARKMADAGGLDAHDGERGNCSAETWLRRSPRLVCRRPLFASASSCRRDLSELFSPHRSAVPIPSSSGTDAAVFVSNGGDLNDGKISNLCSSRVLPGVDLNAIVPRTEGKVPVELPSNTVSNCRSSVQTSNVVSTSSTGSSPFILCGDSQDDEENEVTQCGVKHLSGMMSCSPRKHAQSTWHVSSGSRKTRTIDLRRTARAEGLSMLRTVCSKVSDRVVTGIASQSLKVVTGGLMYHNDVGNMDVLIGEGTVEVLHEATSETTHNGEYNPLISAPESDEKHNRFQLAGSEDEAGGDAMTLNTDFSSPSADGSVVQVTPTSCQRLAGAGHNVTTASSSFTPPTALSLLNLACSPIINPVQSSGEKRQRSLRSRHPPNSQIRCRRSLAEND